MSLNVRCLSSWGCRYLAAAQDGSLHRDTRDGTRLSRPGLDTEGVKAVAQEEGSAAMGDTRQTTRLVLATGRRANTHCS